MAGRIRTYTFTQLPDQILEDGLSWRAILAYVAIRYHAKTKDSAWPGQKRMGELVNLSIDTLLKGLTELRERGYLEIERRTGGSNHYHLYPTYRSQREAPTAHSGRGTAENGMNNMNEQEEENTSRKKSVGVDMRDSRALLRRLFSAAYENKLGGAPRWAAAENALMADLTERWLGGSHQEMRDRGMRAIQAWFDDSTDQADWAQKTGYEFRQFAIKFGALVAAEYTCGKCGGHEYRLFAGAKECQSCND